jgi:hypothetical protein
MYARNLNVTVEPTTPETSQRVSRAQNGFKDTKFVGGLRNLFLIPVSVRSIVAYAKKWRRPPVTRV